MLIYMVVTAIEFPLGEDSECEPQIIIHYYQEVQMFNLAVSCNKLNEFKSIHVPLVS